MMEGQEIVLHPSSSLQVTFQGRVIARAISPSDNAKRHEKHVATDEIQRTALEHLATNIQVVEPSQQDEQ